MRCGEGSVALLLSTADAVALVYGVVRGRLHSYHLQPVQRQWCSGGEGLVALTSSAAGAAALVCRVVRRQLHSHHLQ